MLQRQDLYSLEDYEVLRPAYRQRVMAYKKDYTILLGMNVRLYLENRLTMQYQIQEMLRAEKIFTTEGIQEELDTYNTLVSGGQDIMATMMLVYPDVQQRSQALADLVGIEDKVWLQVGRDTEKIFAVADEDLERSEEHKTSAVHFLRFTLPLPLQSSLEAGQRVTFGISHPNYQEQTTVKDGLLQGFLV